MDMLGWFLTFMGTILVGFLTYSVSFNISISVIVGVISLSGFYRFATGKWPWN